MRARRLARSLLRELHMREYPDPAKAACAVGVKVLEADVFDHVASAVWKEEGHDATIIVSREDSIKRQRFQCALALGYYLHACEEEFAHIEYRTSPKDPSEQTEADKFAHEFALHFLLPRVPLLQRDPPTLAYRFSVPLEIARERLA